MKVGSSRDWADTSLLICSAAIHSGGEFQGVATTGRQIVSPAITIERITGLEFEIQVRGHSVVADMSVDDGGQDGGLVRGADRGGRIPS